MATSDELGQPLVCIVDDDESFREALAGWLASQGLRTACFSSAPAFLEHPAAALASFLVVDVSMPQMSGLDLLDRLAGCGRATPAAVVSSRDDAASRERALAAGAVAFLGKPFEPARLAELIHAALQCSCV